MFPLHTLAFVLWLVMLDPCLISSDNVSRKSIPFMAKVVQKVLADCHTVVLVLFCELFWNPSCRNFMKAKSVVDDFTYRTMTDVQMLCHFNSRPSVIQNHGVDSFNVFFCWRRGWASRSFIISDTCATISEHGGPIIHTLL